ncbi:kinase-like domain [Fusarium albosuccineum]|uniref:Kinase-like domain n=1 Tax=Fusarium albosuccineum TaxID=1237068 RepID=A0A8H4KLG6_9HYPO|nr:kinase-like domain [Fusarium albosuccineum]
MTKGYPPKVVRVRPRREGDEDDDDIVSIRFHGRTFDISMRKSYFTNSPNTTALYEEYREGIDSDWDEEIFEWIIGIFQPLFRQLAPTPLPAFDPDKIRNNEVKPTLSDYLFPRRFGLRLEAVDDEIIPRHANDKGSFTSPRAHLDGDFLDELASWTEFFEPSAVRVAFTEPEKALEKMPKRVLVTLQSGVETVCYFQRAEGELPGGPTENGLVAYKKIHDAGGLPNVNVGRLLGVVHATDTNRTLGILLEYIDRRAIMWSALFKNVSLETREKWASQATDAVTALHRAGAVWGNASVVSIVIDKNENAWVADFRGGYLVGWIDKDKAGTVEGDMQGLKRTLREILETRGDSPESDGGI